MAFEIIIGIIIVLWILWKINDFRIQNTIHVDNRGYERDGYGQLVHRKVAFRNNYDSSTHSKRFREYVIHHIDGDKRNNSPDNLQVLSREDHNAIHGK